MPSNFSTNFNWTVAGLVGCHSQWSNWMCNTDEAISRSRTELCQLGVIVFINNDSGFYDRMHNQVFGKKSAYVSFYSKGRFPLTGGFQDRRYLHGLYTH